MIPRRALEMAVDGGYTWPCSHGRQVIRKVSRRSLEWDDPLTVFIEGIRIPTRRYAWRLAQDEQFWECLCRALNRWDEKELAAEYQRRMKRGEKGFAFWRRVFQ